ncbi:hypothetical protein JOD43_003640 [Pullulanibacillus pueri]|uniref:YrhK domain-containing protein n=1 Tax=Pullulanibacillus pueri TaxID=1437324 RepID=A0A8J2ZYG3_9BACL|nr:YrhK family protein [Pullulanibacillus pueri]MBM7683460.1 hypothetical protein [Pullulanibacillus pueri]GGH86805.1 hypothetical protein GCM10007096_35370 [Pullulanibacillus pueri]
MSKNTPDVHSADRTLSFEWEHHKIIIHHRYQWLHIINDIVIGLWFLVGSFLFFFEAYQKAGTYLFVIGSAQMLIRPLIRIAHKLHVGEIETQKLHF